MVLLLTGGSGFLGSYLVKELGREFDLRILTRNAKSSENSSITHIKCDLRNPNRIDKSLFEDVEVFVHNAAKVKSWPKDLQEGYIQVNVTGTRNLIETAIACDIEKIIYTSSYFALGGTGAEIADENHDNPVKFHHPYVNSKYLAGKVVDELSTIIPITQLLPTAIMGPRMDNPISNVILDHINRRLPGLPGGGKTKFNFVSPEDVAKGYLLAVKSNKTGKYILGGENMAFIEFIELINQRLNLPTPRSLPYWTALVYAWFQELSGNPRLTRGDINVSKTNFQYTSKKAKTELGYKPNAIETVIDPMLHSFYENGRLTKKGKKIVERYFNTKLH